MEFNGKLGPPIGTAVGLGVGVWVAIAEMSSYALLARVGTVIISTLIGLVAGGVVWLFDRMQSKQAQQNASHSDDRFYCPKCGRRNVPDTTSCIKCGSSLSGG